MVMVDMRAETIRKITTQNKLTPIFERILAASKLGIYKIHLSQPLYPDDIVGLQSYGYFVNRSSNDEYYIISWGK